jgi:hypothetical protein
MSDWQPTACMLCECNCGVEVQLGGPDGRHLTKVRGDKAHPASKGYACEKPSRMDYYQNGPDRVRSPLRRRSDGTFEEVDWETAVREVAERFAALRDEHGGESIFYYGGGGQGNHMPAAYSRSTLAALGNRYGSNALAQEKTGEFWVSSRMLGGAFTRADFENCEVGLFIGKNPWFSHGIPHARVTLRALAKDPERCMIVIDPRRSETADLADIHLAPKPGTDAWLLAAMIGVLVQEDLLARRRGALLRSLRGSRGAGARGRAAHRPGGEHGDLRGPGRADEPPLHAGQLPAPSAWLRHRELRQEGCRLFPGQHPAPGLPLGAAQRQGRNQPGDRLAHHLGPGSVQRDPRRDPHRPS